ncbi:MAG: GAF domain-containing protein [Chloroflexi bacterium]|nr:GAF domain-containing protein [Chloroflexota bacterium]
MSSRQYTQRFVYPDDANMVGTEIGKAIETTDPNFRGQIDHRVVLGDGETGYITVRFRIQKNAEGQTVKTFGANQDITARKKVESLLEKQARELDAVAQISTAASTIQETGHLLQTVVDLTKGYFALYHSHIYLLNEMGDTLVLTTGAGDVGRKMVSEGRTIPISHEQSLVARAARSRQAVIVNDVREVSDFLPNPLLPDTRAEMAVPLLVGGRVLGVLDIQGNTPGRFTAQDANIMSTLASQVGIALQNARSFEQYDSTLAELNLLTRRLTREGWDSYLQNTPGEVHYTYGTQPTSLETTNGTAYNGLSKPLTIQGEIIGQLALAEPGQFDDEADEIMSAIAERLSTHLENLRLTDQTQYALAQTESLYSGSGRVVRATTVQEVMDALVESTALRRLDRANIVLYDHPWVNQMPNTGTVIAVWEQNGEPPRAPVGTVYQARQFPSIELFSANHPTLFQDVTTDKRIDPNLRSLMLDRLGMRSLFVFPFIIGSQWWGFISGQASQTAHLTDEEVRQITSLSEQAATVIQTLRLFEQATERAEQLNILNEMARDLTIALDVESAMETIHHYTDLLMDASSFYIALYNNDTQDISFPIAIENGLRQKWRARPFGNGLTEYVIRSGHGLLIKDGVDAWLEANGVASIGNEAQSWLGMPLKLANIILGVVGLQSKVPHVYEESDFDLLSAVASQGSIAIQNARLFEQTQNALAETETLFEVSRKFNAANNPVEIANAVSEPIKASGVVGIDLFFIETDSNNKPEWVELKAVVQYEGVVPIPVGTRFYLPDLPLANFWLSHAGEPIFVEDVREETRLDEPSRLLLEMTGVRSAVYLPLTLAGRWVALIGFRWLAPHTFAPGDKRLYQSIAAQAAVSVNNYQLFDEAQARAQQLEVLTRVETELSQAANEQEIIRALLSYVNWGEPFVSLSYLREDDKGDIAGVATVSAWKQGQFVNQIPDSWDNIQIADLPLLQLWQENESQILLISDVATDPRVTADLQEQARREGNWQATTVLPLRSGGRWQAIVGLTWYEPQSSRLRSYSF